MAPTQKSEGGAATGAAAGKRGLRGRAASLALVALVVAALAAPASAQWAGLRAQTRAGWAWEGASAARSGGSWRDQLRQQQTASSSSSPPSSKSFSYVSLPLRFPSERQVLRRRSLARSLSPTNSSLLPPSEGRLILRNETFALRGDVRELGYFTATVWFGTPPRRFELIVDTGSTITYIPCVDCGDRCGPNHENMWFDPSASSTASYVGCSDSGCDCGSPACGCRDDRRCTYVRSYVEGSKSAGYLLRDAMTLHDGLDPPSVVFGCEESEAGEIYRQKADGLLGLGRSSASVLDQLVRAGELEDAFSLCFGTFDGDGALLLGSAARATGEDGGEAAAAGLLAPPTPLSRVVETPLLRRVDHPYFYTVDLTDMAIGGESLAVHADAYSTGYGAVLDSGTTFAYLPQSVYGAVLLRVREHAIAHGLTQVPGPDPSFADICFAGADPDGDPEKLAQVFPNLTLSFRPMPGTEDASGDAGKRRKALSLSLDDDRDAAADAATPAASAAPRSLAARLGRALRSLLPGAAGEAGAATARAPRPRPSPSSPSSSSSSARTRRLADDGTIATPDASSSDADLPQSVIDAIESAFETPAATTLTDDASAEETYDAFSGASRSAPPPPQLAVASSSSSPSSASSSSSSSSSRRVLHDLTVGPSNYLFVHTKGSGKYCLGVFDNGKQGALLGGILFRNTLVEYDRANSKIRFVPGMACSRLGNALKPACEDMFPRGGGDVAAAGFNGSTQAQIAEDQGDCRAKSAEALAWWPEEAPADDEIALARGEGDQARRAAKRRKDLIILSVLGGVLFIVLGATVYAVVLSGVTGRAARAVLPARWAPGAARARSHGEEERVSLFAGAADSSSHTETGDDGGVGHVPAEPARPALALGGTHDPNAYAGVAESAAAGGTSAGPPAAPAPAASAGIAMTRLFRFGRAAAPEQARDPEASPAAPLQGHPRPPTPPGVDAVQGLGPRPGELSDAELSLALGSSVEAAAGREAEGYVVREDLDDAFAGGVALGATGGDRSALGRGGLDGAPREGRTTDVESLLPKRTPSSSGGAGGDRTGRGLGFGLGRGKAGGKSNWFGGGLFGRGNRSSTEGSAADGETPNISTTVAAPGENGPQQPPGAPATIPANVVEAPPPAAPLPSADPLPPSATPASAAPPSAPLSEPAAPMLPVSSMASVAGSDAAPTSFPSQRGAFGRPDDDEFETIGRADDVESSAPNGAPKENGGGQK